MRNPRTLSPKYFGLPQSFIRTQSHPVCTIQRVSLQRIVKFLLFDNIKFGLDLKFGPFCYLAFGNPVFD